MFLTLLYILLAMVCGGLIGAIFGLIPFFVGKGSGKPVLGKDGFFWSIGAGASLIMAWAIPGIVIGFVIAIMVRDTDRIPSGSAPAQPYGAPGCYAPPPPSHNIGIKCISGPMMGQVYGVGPQGMIIGRDHDCAIRFPANQPGISRHHCSLRWEGGVLMLTDMGSSHGTFLQNGTRLSSQYPTQVPANTRFYLANTSNMFQVVII